MHIECSWAWVLKSNICKLRLVKLVSVVFEWNWDSMTELGWGLCVTVSYKCHFTAHSLPDCLWVHAESALVSGALPTQMASDLLPLCLGKTAGLLSLTCWLLSPVCLWLGGTTPVSGQLWLHLKVWHTPALLPTHKSHPSVIWKPTLVLFSATTSCWTATVS